MENRLAIDTTKEDSVDTQPDELYLTPENMARTTNAVVEECKEEPQPDMDFCFLKTQKQNFKQFKIELVGNTLNFLRQKKNSKLMSIHYFNDLEITHVAVGHKEKCPKTSEVYHALVLLLPSDKTRVVYFQS